MSLASKLNLKPGMRLEVLSVPIDVVLDLEEGAIASASTEADAVLVFVTDLASLRERESVLVGSASADRLTWLAYPKAGQLGTDLSRDKIRQLFSASAIGPVRQVSIDLTWSALRFRPQTR